jgi:hypothetical protein
MKPLCLLLAPLCLIGIASAQDNATPANQLPPPPWLNLAPNPSHWVVTYMTSDDSDSSKGSGDSGGAAPKTPPKTIEVIKSDKIILEQTTDTDGTVTQTWRKDGYQLYKDPAGTVWTVFPVTDQKDPFGQPDYIKTDFAGFDWISQSNFVGIQSVSGDKCLVFKDKVMPLSAMMVSSLQTEALYSGKPADLSSHMVDAEADIDFKTLLPISLKIGKITRVFTYQAPPASPLELPAEAQAALTEYLK